jgi:hypothetical protein
MGKSEKRALIEQKQKELKIRNLTNRCLQFDIKIMELEEDIEQVRLNKDLCEKEIENLENDLTS